MHGTTHRRLCGVLGAGLLLLAGGVVAVVGRHVLRTPTMMAQLGLLTVSGALDIVAAFENPLTARIDWFRLGGLANVALGLALPVGALGWTTARDATGLFLFVVTAVGVTLPPVGE